VLPYGEQQFRQDSVEIVPGGEWGQRCDRVLERAARVIYASSTKLAYGSLSYEYANQLVHGLGLVRARELRTQQVGLVVWDGRPGDGPGGTSSLVARWHEFGMPVWRVDVSSLSPTADGCVPVVRDSSLPDAPSLASATAGQDHRVVALLFADAVGFSQLTDAEIPRYVQEYLGRFAQLIDRYAESILVRETWGDGLFLAFSSADVAGQFAMALSEVVKGVDWRGLGFSRVITLRMALHAGPVHLSTDPITGLPKCSGTHVSRAARLEPKTPPGQVYASEAFAALAALENVQQFSCEPILAVPGRPTSVAAPSR
jgi:class 3 adenylate cyclase